VGFSTLLADTEDARERREYAGIVEQDSALLVALSEGRSLADAVRFAAHSASVSVTRMGAQASIPWRGELETLA